jgi:hypothetical protein
MKQKRNNKYLMEEIQKKIEGVKMTHFFHFIKFIC